MKKNKVLLLIIGIVIAVLFGNIAFGNFLQKRSQEKIDITIATPPAEESARVVVDQIIYDGEEGKDGLTLLKEKAEVEQGPSGLVVAIGGRKADDSKKEFWAFYVNGEMAQVGPAEYKTKTGDKIEWRIEKY